MGPQREARNLGFKEKCTCKNIGAYVYNHLGVLETVVDKLIV